MSAARPIRPPDLRPFDLRLLSCLASLLLGCATAASVEEPSHDLPRYAELVESQVLRSISGEPHEAHSNTKRVAVVEIARALDPLEPDAVRTFRLDVSTRLLTETADVFRVKALVAVHTVGPPEQMRAVLQGTGTVRRGTDREADLRLAAKGAVRAALRGLLQVCRRFS